MVGQALSTLGGSELFTSKTYLSDDERESEDNIFRSKSDENNVEEESGLGGKGHQSKAVGDKISPKEYSFRRLMLTGSGYVAGKEPSESRQGLFAEEDDLFSEADKDNDKENTTCANPR